MTPAFEAFLARLYVDAGARRSFLADPAAAARDAGLSGDELAAAVAIDRVGLELAAAGFEYKRQRKRPPRSAIVRLWHWLFRRSHVP